MLAEAKLRRHRNPRLPAATHLAFEGVCRSPPVDRSSLTPLRRPSFARRCTRASRLGDRDPSAAGPANRPQSVASWLEAAYGEEIGRCLESPGSRSGHPWLMRPCAGGYDVV